MQVVADKDNNTLLIVATPLEYTVIEAALKKLDIPARQVLMEVTIAEVTLKDEVDFGLEWLFKGGAPSGRGVGGLHRLARVQSRRAQQHRRAQRHRRHQSGARAGTGLHLHHQQRELPRRHPGGAAFARQYGNTKVIATPRLAALDNQKATIKSGDASRSISKRA